MLKTVLPVLLAPVILPTVVGVGAIALALMPVILTVMLVAALVLKSVD